MQAMTLTAPPHSTQVSILKTRFKRYAEVIAAYRLSSECRILKPEPAPFPTK